MEAMVSPAAWRERIAVSLPDPGPLTNTETCLTPHSIARRAAVSAATDAAKGVPFLVPLNPQEPAEVQAMVFPFSSVTLTMVLLKED